MESIATADVIYKHFKNQKLYVLLSGGTNQKTSQLSYLCDLIPNGVAIGSYARKLLNRQIYYENFWNDYILIGQAVTKAECLNNDIKRYADL